MAPLNIRSRKLLLNDSELPCTDRHSPLPCSPEVNEEAFVFQDPGFPKQSRIDGEVWPPIFKPAFVRGAKALKVRDSDVFVCTYPKCGTTWIQHICSQLLSDDYGPDVGHGKDALSELCVTSPMIERMGAKFADNLEGRRLLKTHFAWHNLPKNSKAKYIYAVRNPKDCLTSYFFHNRNFKIYDFEFGNFADFFKLFMSDNIAFGNYFEHLLSWLPHLSDDNVLFLKYEDMCADLRSAVIKIGRFLGGKAAAMVEDETIVESIVRSSTIGAMKKDQWRWFPEHNLRQNTFIRKGGSGDWKNYFNREQSKRVDDVFRKRLSGTIAENWWIEEMSWDEDEESDDMYEDEGIFEADIDSSSSLSSDCSTLTGNQPAAITRIRISPTASSSSTSNRHLDSSSSVKSTSSEVDADNSLVSSQEGLSSLISISHLNVPSSADLWRARLCSTSPQSSGFGSLSSSFCSSIDSFQ
ncbi:unnamed protein product [Anisakis simplex]|uniref:Sulfotransfer_1 domain-containing protein n=1 Tax=Anisakis simplex TaxID=6269 RepID=A0A0M3K1J3_ANISI|nr:unnamed protein product [Anisakis simplex]